MTDRDNRYAPQPRSPPTFNPARVSLPVNSSGYPSSEQSHHHVISAGRREIIPPRNSSFSSNAGTVTTTYTVTTHPIPTRNSSVREGSRARRSTLDNHNRHPTIATAVRDTDQLHTAVEVLDLPAISIPRAPKITLLFQDLATTIDSSTT